MICKKKLNETMGRLGFRESLAGTRYIRAACDMIDRDRHAMMCKEVYPTLARSRSAATMASVERAIRTAVEDAKRNPNWEEAWRGIGGTSCTYNSEVIHRLVNECQDEN